MTTQLHDSKSTSDIDSLCSKALDSLGYYRASDLARLFSLPVLGSWRAHCQIFALSFDSQAAYPAFLFTPEGLDQDAAAVNAALPLAMSSTQRLLWWTMPDELGSSRVESLKTDPGRIAAQARELSDQWELAAAVDEVFAPRLA
jgi:hypothetical protein